MSRIEITAVEALDETINYRFIDFINFRSLDAGETGKQAKLKTMAFIDKSYLPAIRDAGRTTYLSNGELKGALRSLAGLGKKIYKEFVPDTLRKLIHDLPDKSVLTFVSDKVGIPWELVYNDVDFWGRRFIIHKIERKYSQALEPKKLELNKVVNIIGATVDESTREKSISVFSDHENLFKELIIIDGTKIKSVNDVYQSIEGADLIHITCHGEVDENRGLYLQIVTNSSPFLNLTPSAISVLEIKPGCLVFANACVSAGMAPGIEKPITLGTEFCSNEKEGGAFIGTLDLIPDIPATEFAKCFYSHFFQGNSVGEGLMLAKRTQLGQEDQRYGMFPLVYSLYGNPYIRCDELIKN